MEHYTIWFEFIKYTGGAGVIALMWYIYHKSTTKYLGEIFAQQKERDEEYSKNLGGIIKQYSDWQDKNFKLLQDMINMNLLQNEKLQEIKTKIDTNMWCPFWRNFNRNGSSFVINPAETQSHQAL